MVPHWLWCRAEGGAGAVGVLDVDAEERRHGGVPAGRAAGGGGEVRQLAPPVQTVLVQEPATVSCYTDYGDNLYFIVLSQFCISQYVQEMILAYK